MCIFEFLLSCILIYSHYIFKYLHVKLIIYACHTQHNEKLYFLSTLKSILSVEYPVLYDAPYISTQHTYTYESIRIYGISHPRILQQL
jgi:hypothetical protein